MISFGLQITCEAAALAVVSWWLFGSTIPAVRARKRRKAALDAFIYGSDLNRDGIVDAPGVADIKLGLKTYSQSGN